MAKRNPWRTGYVALGLALALGCGQPTLPPNAAPPVPGRDADKIPEVAPSPALSDLGMAKFTLLNPSMPAPANAANGAEECATGPDKMEIQVIDRDGSKMIQYKDTSGGWVDWGHGKCVKSRLSDGFQIEGSQSAYHGCACHFDGTIDLQSTNYCTTRDSTAVWKSGAKEQLLGIFNGHQKMQFAMCPEPADDNCARDCIDPILVIDRSG